MELVDRSHGAVLPPAFGASLRTARLSRNITLDAVATRTKLNRVFFQDLERNDLSKWPSSRFYRESYLRAYCEAIGLDPREVIDGFRRELEPAAAPNTAVPSDTRRRLTPATIPIILAVTFVVFYALARWLAPAPQNPAAAVGGLEKPALVGEAAAGPVPARAEPAVLNVDLPAERPAAPGPRAIAPVDAERIEGALTITSTPPGATVLVNGINRGRTPAQVQFLPAGSYTIRFILPGHRSLTLRATISAKRRQVQVSTELSPVAQPAATE